MPRLVGAAVLISELPRFRVSLVHHTSCSLAAMAPAKVAAVQIGSVAYDLDSSLGKVRPALLVTSTSPALYSKLTLTCTRATARELLQTSCRSRGQARCLPRGLPEVRSLFPLIARRAAPPALRERL